MAGKRRRDAAEGTGSGDARASSASMNIFGTSKPVCSVISWKQVGLVTLISVRLSPITSRPTSSRPRAASIGPMRLGDLAVARRDRLRHALAAGREVAADLAALRDARQRDAAPASPSMTRMRLSPVDDLGHVALHHHGLGAVAVQRLDDAAEVQAVGADAEDAHAAHAVERLQDDVAVLGVEARHRRRVARDERRRDELRELEDRELLGMVAQRRAAC